MKASIILFLTSDCSVEKRTTSSGSAQSLALGQLFGPNSHADAVAENSILRYPNATWPTYRITARLARLETRSNCD